MKRKVVFAFLFLTLIQGVVFAFSNPFKKQNNVEHKEGQPMVHTVEEWMESATNVKMDMRQREESPLENEYIILPAKRPAYLEKYNVKPGYREMNLSGLYKTQNVRSVFVADPSVTGAVYSETYYYPQTSQTATTLYYIELDKHMSKKERLEDVSIFEHTRYPLISTALPYLKQGFFSTLTVVDFSSDGKTVLVKEKRGSNKFGIYETYLWLYYLTENEPMESECYRNNLDFSNEMQISFDAAVPVGRADAEYPLTRIDAASEAVPNVNFEPEIKNGNEKVYPKSELGGGLLPYLKEEEVNEAPSSKVSVPEYISTPAKLNYADIKEFIKTVWKEEEVKNSYKKQWFNTVPPDFRVDIPENVKGKIGYGVRLNLLNETIKAYWFDRTNLILNYIRWDIRGLGFSASNQEEIIAEAFGFNKDGKEISLGNWAVNIKNGLVRRVDEDEDIQIQANGLFLEEKLNTR